MIPESYQEWANADTIEIDEFGRDDEGLERQVREKWEEPDR